MKEIAPFINIRISNECSPSHAHRTSSSCATTPHPLLETPPPTPRNPAKFRACNSQT